MSDYSPAKSMRIQRLRDCGSILCNQQNTPRRLHAIRINAEMFGELNRILQNRNVRQRYTEPGPRFRRKFPEAGHHAALRKIDCSRNMEAAGFRCLKCQLERLQDADVAECPAGGFYHLRRKPLFEFRTLHCHEQPGAFHARSARHDNVHPGGRSGGSLQKVSAE